MAIQIYTFLMALAAILAVSLADSSAAEKNLTYTKMDGKRTLFFFETDSVKITLPNETDSKEYTNINVNSTGYLTDLKTVNETTQDFTFKFEKDQLTFTFAWKKGESRYRLDKVTFVNGNATVNVSDPIFTVETPDLRITGSKQFKVNTQGYQCGSLKISLEGISNQSNQTAQLELSNFKFAAFQNSTKTNFVECRQEPGSSVIPLAVGGGLLVFMGIALVGYICMRNRAS